MPEKKLFKSFLKQYWPYLIIVTFSFFTFSNFFYFDLCFQLFFSIWIILAECSTENKLVQSSIVLSHHRLLVTQTFPFRCTQWQCHPMAGICSALRTTVLCLDSNWLNLVKERTCVRWDCRCKQKLETNCLTRLHNLLLKEPTDVKTALYLVLICFPDGSYLTVSYDTSVSHQYIIYESRMHLSYI